MIEIVFWVLIGCILGIFSGIVPGIHINTIAAVVLLLPQENGLNFALMIVAMSVVHSFVDFVPSILLGAVDSESFLATLPGHRLMLKGLGLYAIRLTIIGGLIAGILSLAFLPIFFLFVEKYVPLLYTFVPLILLLIIVSMILSEKQNKKWAIATVLLSGTLGIIVLTGNLPIKNGLFALVSGFFGAAGLLYSLKSVNKIPLQKISNFSYEKGFVVKGSLLGMLAGSLVAIMPSVGPAEAAFVVRRFLGKISSELYLVILGSINTVNIVFSFFVLYLLGKTRSGVAAAVKQLIPIDFDFLMFSIAVVIFSLGFGAIITDVISKKAINWLQKMDYKKITIATIAILIALCTISSGFLGLCIFAIASAIGLIPISANIKRTHSMAFLIFPTIIIYLT